MNSPPPTTTPPPPPPPMEVISDEHLNNTWDFDWGSLLDCTLNDDQLNDEINLAWNFEEDGRATLAALSDPSLLTTTTITTTTTTTTTEVSGSDGSDRIRKRDPRLICENFLAGRIPCACPEMDEKAEEEEEEDEDEEEQEGRRKVRKKRPRVAAVVVNIRCQVPECGVDITELKGYHRRHRVCLRCANASEVFLDGEHKRFCQQCGKFHILPDFDEGKRSCRRKLERHNKRRRRKPTNVGGVGEKEIQAEQPSEVTGFDNKGDDRAGKDITTTSGIVFGTDNSCLSNQIVDEGIESEDGRLSPLSLPSSSQNIQSDSVKSLVTSSKAKTNVQKDSSQCTLSSSFGDNKSSYSSLCPAGRISFKLYDWNPAEFPRRLRHQIFQWLDSMPVELEGYIRPGCTILTVFMAMPWFMWDKLSEDTYSYIHDFLSAPESMLFGRGRMVVYLNDMVFQVLKGETSLMTVKVELQPPRLHYVHPTFFEAGKPMEFIICGTNLLRPKFRFLISFAGTYLAYDYCASTSHESIGLHPGSKEDRALSCEHQSYKIYVPNTDPKLFGPAFVEVENESGISNFIPVLIGDRHVCSEMQAVQQKFHKSLFSKGLQYAACDPLSDSCEGFVLRQAAMSELLLDVAWLLKEPQFEEMHSLSTSFQIQRFNCLLNFLIQNDSTVVLEKVLHALKIFTDGKQLYKPDIETNDADFKLFGKYMECAKQIVHQKCQDLRLLDFENCVVNSLNHEDNEKLHVPTNSQDKELSEEKMLGSTASDFKWSESSPLINREVVMNVNCRQQLTKTWLPNTRGRLHSSRIMGSRRFLLVVGMTAVCFGVCVVVIQPNKVGDLAVSIHRCLFGNSNS